VRRQAVGVIVRSALAAALLTAAAVLAARPGFLSKPRGGD
jgi:hypothetical protein